MAQLKDLIVAGASRLIGDAFINGSLTVNKLLIPTASNGTTYGAGTNGYVLKTNGTTVYWSPIAGTTSAIGSATQPIYWTGSAFAAISSYSGNAATATKLANAITINGTAFDGSQNITTDNWGTARTISIKNAAGTTGTSINGSQNAELVIPSTMNNFTSITSATFVGALSGNASTASKWNTARTLTLTGSVTGSVLIDGSKDVSLVTTTNHTHNYASSQSAGGPADTVWGRYTGSGGQQNPNYFGTNKVGFLMMNTTVNSNSEYKDWLIMDSYNGIDVGGTVALGVNRQHLGAYIMRSESGRTAWAESAELLGTHNYTSYTVTKTGSGASGTWGISISGNATTATTATKLSNTSAIGGTSTPVYFSSGGVPVACGSSLAVSITGNAATASALGTNAGSATKPVYFSNGVPVACTYAVNKEVPASAVFTDTNTTYTLSASGNTITLTPSSGSAQTATIQTAISTQVFTLATGTWTANSTYGYIYTASWTGIRTSSVVGFDGLFYTGSSTTLSNVTSATKKNIDKSADYIYAIALTTDIVTFYAHTKPTVNLCIRLAQYS